MLSKEIRSFIPKPVNHRDGARLPVKVGNLDSWSIEIASVVQELQAPSNLLRATVTYERDDVVGVKQPVGMHMLDDGKITGGYPKRRNLRPLEPWSALLHYLSLLQEVVRFHVFDGLLCFFQ